MYRRIPLPTINELKQMTNKEWNDYRMELYLKAICTNLDTGKVFKYLVKEKNRVLKVAKIRGL